MTASQLIQMSKRLAASRFPTLPADLQGRVVKALATAKQALEQRNKILHGPVGGSLEPNTTAFYSRRLNARGWLDAAVHSPDELDAMGANLHAVMQELDDLTFEIKTALS